MGSDNAIAVIGTVKSPKKNRRNHRQKAGHGTPSAQTNPPASKRTGRESSSASAGSHTKIRAKKPNHVKQPVLASDPQHTDLPPPPQHTDRPQPQYAKKHGSNISNRYPATMTVILNRVDLLDGAAARAARRANDDHCANANDALESKQYPPHPYQQQQQQNKHAVKQYHFEPDVSALTSSGGGDYDSSGNVSSNDIGVIRAPYVGIYSASHGSFGPSATPHRNPNKSDDGHLSSNASTQSSDSNDDSDEVMDTRIPNPHPQSVVHDKYWAQRRRLFSRFDKGVMLDSEGWYSVTPEVIADHVAARVGALAASDLFRERSLDQKPATTASLPPPPGFAPMPSERKGIVMLDAFCGCGGNAIAFGKLRSELVSLVVCVDVDRDKLKMAAHNASLYDIPTDKILFIEGSTFHVMGKCYRDGKNIVPPKPDMNDITSNSGLRGYLCSVLGIQNGTSVIQEKHAGFTIGGVELLPPHIDAVFMDPPWGGIDYNSLGKNGYDLAKHMKIKISSKQDEALETSFIIPVEKDISPKKVLPLPDKGSDSFWDESYAQPVTVSKDTAPDEYVDGVDLLKMAAAATKSHVVLYDLPRNTNKTSLAEAAIAAGYRGNVKLEEHFLNGRLKTVTAYLGSDYSHLLS
mmetsp:Transcript_7684/g.13849  ORF Transcript_7684/g.13849 Transcript_7684/m.13849 type:complete len:634 (-) Transcript_7684:75-1976(-)